LADRKSTTFLNFLTFLEVRPGSSGSAPDARSEDAAAGPPIRLQLFLSPVEITQ
jgi:hypothetical protein